MILPLLRFWDQGYWLDHLAGKPYHIRWNCHTNTEHVILYSALFVVDLDLFRQRQVGTTLRAMYNALSADPNSLANLDQDLPNYAQDVVPIFSLPQEWLWCETWCSDKIKNKAKTIDLCNNPLTHESKLTQARRIVPEWIEYDKVRLTSDWLTVPRPGVTARVPRGVNRADRLKPSEKRRVIGACSISNLAKKDLNSIMSGCRLCVNVAGASSWKRSSVCRQSRLSCSGKNRSDY